MNPLKEHKELTEKKEDTINKELSCELPLCLSDLLEYIMNAGSYIERVEPWKEVKPGEEPETFYLINEWKIVDPYGNHIKRELTKEQKEEQQAYSKGRRRYEAHLIYNTDARLWKSFSLIQNRAGSLRKA